jgi:gentisate 1,2-dioxygenase
VSSFTGDATSIKSLDDLYDQLDALHMESGWHRKSPALWAEPRSAFQPMRWRYEDARVVLDAAGRLMDTTQAERRNLTLTNPCENNTYATLRTIVAAYQMMLPGEQARSHRHSPNALRVILEGEGSYTIVDGARLDMHPGDVVLTPGWGWHAHVTEGATPCYWIDVLDVPLIHLLETMFYEKHPDEMEVIRTRPATSSMAFPMSDIRTRLAAAGPGAPLELGNPALSTLAIFVHELKAGTSTEEEQTTANNVFVVLAGSGTTDVAGTRLDWKFGDIVAVPIWNAFSHRASADSLLLRVTDAPVQRVLGLLRNATRG